MEEIKTVYKKIKNRNKILANNPNSLFYCCLNN